MNDEDKVYALKTLVAEAIWERNHFDTSPFEGSFDTPELNRLLDALKTTDALDVLDDVLKKENN